MKSQMNLEMINGGKSKIYSMQKFCCDIFEDLINSDMPNIIYGAFAICIVPRSYFDKVGEALLYLQKHHPVKIIGV